MANVHAHEASDHQAKTERRADQEDAEFKRHRATAMLKRKVKQGLYRVPSDG
jgi:hypothetical protein